MSDRQAQHQRRLADARALASYLNVSLPTIWRESAPGGWLPAPFYITPSAPRWDLNEVDRALEAKRARPAEAKAARRQAKLAMAS